MYLFRVLEQTTISIKSIEHTTLKCKVRGHEKCQGKDFTTSKEKSMYSEKVMIIDLFSSSSSMYCRITQPFADLLFLTEKCRIMFSKN